MIRPRWRWALPAGLVALALLVARPLWHSPPGLPCRPEMALPEGLLAPVAGAVGQVQALTGLGATWHVTGPQSLSNEGIETAGGRLPWRAGHARALCAEALPCALHVASDTRFALLWVEPAGAGYAGAMVVQDSPTRRLTLSTAPEPEPEAATCAALAAWVALARARLSPPA